MRSVASLATTAALTAAMWLVPQALSPARLHGAPTVLVPTLDMPSVADDAVNATTIDDGWYASRLAWVIEHRRYGEIEMAAAAIDPASPYARWVPAAIGLAVEQLDATATAYAQMGRCRELRGFLRRVGQEWPDGRNAMRPVSCEIGTCGTGRSAMVKAFGGIAAHRHVESVLRMQRFAERTAEIAQAAAIGDHAMALSSCAGIRHDGPMLPTCLAEACRAHELAIAEVLLPYADADAIESCIDAGVTFVDGFAHAEHPKQPVELVRVHPDAPRD